MAPSPIRSGPNLLARIDRSDPWDQCAIHCSCSESTFQASTQVWVGAGPVIDPGGVNSETTSWIWRPPLLITNRTFMTPLEPCGTVTFRSSSSLPVQSGLTV